MPKVSEKYMADRRAQILDAARRCFVRNGFHQTSMQDLFAESGLSAGAVYRYFASKDDMVFAIADDTIEEVIGTLVSLASADSGVSLGEALAVAVELVARKDETDQLCTLAVQAWAEALRNPDMAARFSERLRRSRAEIARMVRTRQAAGLLPADVRPTAIAATITGIMPGYILQRALLGPAAVREVPAGLRALWSESVTGPPSG